jgi:hypothetical protein
MAPENIIQKDFEILKGKIRRFFKSSQDEIIANYDMLEE